MRHSAAGLPELTGTATFHYYLFLRFKPNEQKSKGFGVKLTNYNNNYFF